MRCSTIALLLFFILQVFGELLIKKDEKVTIKFHGSKLAVRLTYPGGNEGTLAICFGSVPGTTSKYCPSGYAALFFAAGHKEKTVKLEISRDGEVDQSLLNFEGKLRFNSDDSLDVLLILVPDKATVTLENAVLQEKNQKTKPAVSNVVIGIIVAGIGLFFLGILAVFFTLFFVCRKKHMKSSVPSAVPTVVEDREKSVHISKSIQMSLPDSKVTAPKLSSATVVSKNTSTSTTKPSDEKDHPNVNVLKATVALPRALRSVSKESKTVSNELHIPASKSEAVKTSKTMHSLPTAKSTQLTMTTKQSTLTTLSSSKAKMLRSPSLPVDVTQSPTQNSPSTEPTPEFSYGIVANNIAANSAYKVRAYLPANEAPKPGSSRQQRSGRIVDEVVEFNRSLETYICFAQREQYLSGHDHMMITERIKFTLHHKLSDGERALLKAAPTDAPRLADILVQQIDAIIKEYCFEHDAYKFDMQQAQSFWRTVNNYNTMASVGCVVMYRLWPTMFSLKENSLLDTKVRKMPLCGLYTLLLDTKLPHSFRVELAFELRRKAADIISRVQKAALRDTCFPTTYLTLIYYKNKRSFVQYLEVHSKDPKKK